MTEKLCLFRNIMKALTLELFHKAGGQLLRNCVIIETVNKVAFCHTVSDDCQRYHISVKSQKRFRLKLTHAYNTFDFM